MLLIAIIVVFINFSLAVIKISIIIISLIWLPISNIDIDCFFFLNLLEYHLFTYFY